MSEKLTLFDRFGGTRKMAEALNEPPSTVQSWKSAGRIPAFKQPDVLAKARELALDVTADDIIFPLGREDMAANDCASATKSGDFIRDAESGADKSAENIRDHGEVIDRKGEADSHGPFLPTSSRTSAHPPSSAESPSSRSSSPEPKAA